MRFAVLILNSRCPSFVLMMMHVVFESLSVEMDMVAKVDDTNAGTFSASVVSSLES